MKQRFPVIDAIRGYCLVNIFINHVTAGVLTRFSPSNFGFSDSADIFVLLAGVSTFLAFGDLGFRESLVALWRRAARLYKYNLALIAATLVCLLLMASLVGSRVMLNEPVLDALIASPSLAAAWHLIALWQTIGFSVVLRLYIALMLMAPLLVWLASTRWWLPLPPAVLIWILAGQFGLVAHDSLTGTPLMLTILPWTLIFACGLALGAAMRQGVSLPRSPALLVAALAIVIGYFVLLHSLPIWSAGQAWVDTRNEHFWLGASKSYQSPLRVLHTLSLVYLFLAYPKAPVLRLVHGVGHDNPLARLGRRSLQVFAVSAVFAVTVDEVVNLANLRWGSASPAAIMIEVALVSIGLALMMTVAKRSAPWRAASRLKAAPTAST